MVPDENRDPGYKMVPGFRRDHVWIPGRARFKAGLARNDGPTLLALSNSAILPAESRFTKLGPFLHLFLLFPKKIQKQLYQPIGKTPFVIIPGDNFHQLSTDHLR